MSLLSDNTYASPGNNFFAIVGSEIQTLGLTGNTLSLTPGGGSVDIATASSVATSTNKLTEVSFDGGIGETLVQGNTIFLDPVNSVNIRPKLECPRIVSDVPGGVYTEISNEPTVQGIYTTGDIQSNSEIRLARPLTGATASFDINLSNNTVVATSAGISIEPTTSASIKTSNNIFVAGDVGGTNNTYKVEVNDGVGSATIGRNTNRLDITDTFAGLIGETPTTTVAMGDVNGFVNGTKISIPLASGNVAMTTSGTGSVSITNASNNGVLNMGSTAPGASTSVEIASAGLLPSMFGSFPGARLLNGLIKEVFGGPAAGVFITKPIKLLGTFEVKNSGDETGPEHLQLSYNNSTDIGQIRVNTGAAKLVLEGQGGGVELKVPTSPQGDLILTGVPSATALTTHNVGLKATSTGLDITKYLKVKLGAGYIWIPYLETDPSL